MAALNAVGRAYSPLHEALVASRCDDAGYDAAPLLRLVLAADADQVNRTNCDFTLASPLQLAALFHGREVVRALLQRGADPSWQYIPEEDDDCDSESEEAEIVSVACRPAWFVAVRAFMDHGKTGPLEALLESGVPLPRQPAAYCMEAALDGRRRLSAAGLLRLAKCAPLDMPKLARVMAREMAEDPASTEAREYLSLMAPWLVDDEDARGAAHELFKSEWWPSVEGGTLTLQTRCKTLAPPTDMGIFMAKHGCTKLVLRGVLAYDSVSLRAAALEELCGRIKLVQAVAGSLPPHITFVLAEPLGFVYPLLVIPPPIQDLLKQPSERSSGGASFRPVLHNVNPNALGALLGVHGGWAGVLATCFVRKLAFEVWSDTERRIFVYGSAQWPHDRVMPVGCSWVEATVFVA